MVRERMSRSEKKLLTRQAIISAAATLIARYGADATSLDRIAEHAGYTKGAVYSNFEGKEDLLLALADAAGATVDMRDVVDGTAPLADQLAELGVEAAAVGRTISRSQWRLHLEMFLYALRNDRLREKATLQEKDGREVDGHYLEEIAAQRGETLPMSGPELVTVLSALAQGLALKQALDPDAVSDDLISRAFRLMAGGDVGERA